MCPNRCNPSILKWFICGTITIAVIWNLSRKIAFFKLETTNQRFFNCYYISFQNMQSFEFLVSVINDYHIHGLHLFWDNFDWFLSPNKSWGRIFSLSFRRHYDRWFILVIFTNLSARAGYDKVIFKRSLTGLN